MINPPIHHFAAGLLLLTIASAAPAETQKSPQTVRVGLASLRLAENLEAGVEKVLATLTECPKRGIEIVCFPETYLPGLRGADRNLPPIDQPAMERALERIAKGCAKNRVTAILGIEWKSALGLENRAVVVSSSGEVLGYQTKNQITPGGESENYVPDGTRQIFDVGGVKFGISVCHEGWRYPETVRWAAVRGAQIVFQPQVTGGDHLEPRPPQAWGESFYEKAMVCRAEENSVYFVSVNRAMQRQNSASSVVDPNGDLVEFVPRGEEKLLAVDLDLSQATGRYADRFQPKLYEERAPAVMPKIAAKPAAGRPNILFVGIDDLRTELGCYGAAHVSSPNIDGLAAGGVLFERAYCQSPVCGASRSSLMSGRRPTRERFANWFSEIRHDLPGALTLPAHFKQNGYHTVGRGKLFHDTRDAVESWSEAPWPAAASNVKRFVLDESRQMTRRGAGTPWRERGPPFEGRGHELPDDAYPDGELCDRALADLERLSRQEQPFFLAVGFWKPHLPFTAPGQYWARYDPDTIPMPTNPSRSPGMPNAAWPVWTETEKELRHYSLVPQEGPLPADLARDLHHAYLACISYIDAQVGKLLGRLDELGLAQNTIVVLWSDHGWMLGEHGLWGKKLLHEQCLRVPLIVHGPNVAKGGRCAGLVELIDLFPTLCEAAELPKPENLDGASFAANLANPALPAKDAAFSRMYDGDSVTTATHRLTQWTDVRRFRTTGRVKQYARVLFDRAADPNENTNIAEREESKAAVERLTEMLDGYLAETNRTPRK